MSSSTYSGMVQSAGHRCGRHATSVFAAVVRRSVPVLLLCLLAPCSGAGAGRGDGHVASPGTAATATVASYRSAPAAAKELLVRPGMEHGTELLSDLVVRQAVLDFLDSHDG